MQIKDKDAFTRAVEANDITMAQLGRKVGGVSRQFIWSLAKGERTSCSAEVAARIEWALHVFPGTLFAPGDDDNVRSPRSKLSDVAS